MSARNAATLILAWVILCLALFAAVGVMNSSAQGTGKPSYIYGASDVTRTWTFTEADETRTFDTGKVNGTLVKIQDASGNASAAFYSCQAENSALSSCIGLGVVQGSATPDQSSLSHSRSYLRVVSRSAPSSGALVTVVTRPEGWLTGENANQALNAMGIGGGGGGFDACRSGKTKGGGLDADTGLYLWTCGNYPWSAEVGGVDANGVSDYDTPTTAGGNSWTMTCSGDGVGNQGTTKEQSACLYAGEQIKMYSMADIMLAQDNTVRGGNVYLPSGLYHDAYCGQDASGNPNNCPVLQNDPTHATRKVIMWRASLNLELTDPDGPLHNGRTGAYMLSAHGADVDGDGILSDDVSDPGLPAGYLPDHWVWHQGTKPAQPVCAWDDGDTGCNAYSSVSTVLQSETRSLGSDFGRSGAVLILEDFKVPNRQQFAAADLEICIDNRVSSGVCSGDTRVRCTDNGGVRDSEIAGDCSSIGLGTCVGMADAIQLKQATLDPSDQMLAVISANPQRGYGEVVEGNPTSSAFTVMLGENDDTSCDGGNGEYFRLAHWGDPGNVDWEPFHAYGHHVGEYLLSENQGTLWPTTAEDYMQQDIWIDGGTFMPAVWIGRDSATATADCPSASGQSASTPCDEVDFFYAGVGYGGGFRNTTTWFGGGGDVGHFAFSLADGNNRGFRKYYVNNAFMHGQGLGTDASGWIFKGNLWQGWDTHTTALFKSTFAPGFQLDGEQFRNNVGNILIEEQNAGTSLLRNIELQNNHFVRYFSLGKSRRLVLDGINGWGNIGPVFILDPRDISDNSVDAFDIHVSNVQLSAHGFIQGSQNRCKALICRTDFNNNSSYNAGEINGSVVFENIHMSASADDSMCIMFFEGLTGDESDAANGLNRAVDDDRHKIFVRDVAIENIGTCTDTSPANGICDVGASSPRPVSVGDPIHRFFCFGNSTGNTEAHGDDANIILDWADVSGPISGWERLSIGGQHFPDNPYPSMPAADARDCNDLPEGTVVRIHDDNTAGGACSATAGVLDGGGTERSVCTCDGAGNWGP